MNFCKKNSWIKKIAVLFVVLLGLGLSNASNASAQSPEHDATANLPDAPDSASQQQPAPQPAASTDDDGSGKQTKRILGIVPNFRSVSANTKLPPMSVKEKFIGAAEDSFDYSSFIFAAGLAGVAQAGNSYPQFHQGMAGFGRYYWHTFADQTNENFMVEFIFPSALHQDPRYYTLGSGGFAKRAWYSFSRVLITRTDSGNETFNDSEIVGAGAAAGISSLYYPTVDRTWTKVGQRWLTNVLLDGGTFMFKEFWPDINDHVFHQKD